MHPIRFPLMGSKEPAVERYVFPASLTPLPFSGERYVPSIGDQIQHEHFHRYLFAIPFCAGKDVLDVACGEGYGAALLGTVARSVIGIDASAEAVDHAQRQYASGVTSFAKALATDMPVPSCAVDTVVCFETIEHLAEHETLVREIRRVMRSDGLLILSTPDRDAYLKGEEPNPFHIRELSRTELIDLLGAHFRHVSIGGQESGSGSTIVTTGGTGERNTTYFSRRDGNEFEAAAGPTRPTYLIALASDSELPAAATSILMDRQHLPTLHAKYRQELDRVWREANARGEHASQLADETDRIRDALTTARAEARGLIHQRDALEHERAALIGERDSLLAALEATYASASWRLTAPLRLAKSAVRRVVARIRQAVRLRSRLSVLRGPRTEAASTESLGDAPPRHRLIPLEGEDAFPISIRDEQIAYVATEWARRHAPRLMSQLLEYRPLVSVLMPTYNTPLDVLERAIDSVVGQTYDHWELIVVDDGSTSSELHDYLARREARDARITVLLEPENRGISAATNRSLASAAGEIVAFLDHDDELHPDALAEVVRAFADEPRPDAVYTDQEYIERDGTPSGPLLKPDWSPRLFWGVMYVGHLLAVRRSVAIAAGGFDSSFDNVQDFEFMLRVSEQTSRIAHVPKTLYRWRRIPGSVAFHGDEKPNIERLQAAAVTAHLARTGVPAVAEPHPYLAHRTTIVPASRAPTTITVLIGPGDQEARMHTRASIAGSAGGHQVDIVAPESAERLANMTRSLRTDFVLSVDAGMRFEASDWLEHLLLYAALPDIAVVAPVIVDQAGRVEQAGLIMSREGTVLPAMTGRDPADDGYAGSLSCAREVSAVSGACALVSRATLEELGGFEAAFTSADYAWLDLSLRALKAGFWNVVTPRAVARRTMSRERSVSPLQRRLLEDRWSASLDADPFHSSHFAAVIGGYGT